MSLNWQPYRRITETDLLPDRWCVRCKKREATYVSFLAVGEEVTLLYNILCTVCYGKILALGT